MRLTGNDCPAAPPPPAKRNKVHQCYVGVTPEMAEKGHCYAVTDSIKSTFATSAFCAKNLVNTKVIVLKSAGDKTFCSGASFNELQSINSEADGKNSFSYGAAGHLIFNF